jgi:HD superfamily phosphohydrolase
MRRVSFYDPLYDFVTFEEAEHERERELFDAGFTTDAIKGTSKQIKPFLDTVEFNRLAFLRQSNLAFLVYPSATHTRFAHAVGCCYLGYIAAREIRVGIRGREANDRAMPLARWLDDHGWKEEFLLALLLHDVGHFPFSHALEGNRDLWQALGREIAHEDVAHEYITGEGPMADAIREKCGEVEDVPYLSQVVKRTEHLDASVVSFLIRGAPEDISDRDQRMRSELRMLHELTSGLLDLDRIDHYRRDSYFSGMKVGSNINFSCLLNGFSIWYDPLSADAPHEVRLSNGAVGHALTLLHAKERLVHDCFETEENLAYEVMLHAAFNLFVFGDRFYDEGHPDGDPAAMSRLVSELLILTDEELLVRLAQDGTAAVRSVVARIRNRMPFAFALKAEVDKRRAPRLADVRAAIAVKASVNPGDVLLRAGRKFGADRSRHTGEWLHLDSLADERGESLDSNRDYRRQIAHFKGLQEDNQNVLWVFTSKRSEDDVERITRAAREVLKS